MPEKGSLEPLWTSLALPHVRMSHVVRESTEKGLLRGLHDNHRQGCPSPAGVRTAETPLSPKLVKVGIACPLGICPFL